MMYGETAISIISSYSIRVKQQRNPFKSRLPKATVNIHAAIFILAFVHLKLNID